MTAGDCHFPLAKDNKVLLKVDKKQTWLRIPLVLDKHPLSSTWREVVT